MPVYRYKREDGTYFETHQSMNADKLEKCPDTGQDVTLVITGGEEFFAGGPSEKKRRKHKRQKNLRENPNHTTLSEYKPGGTLHNRARERSKRRVQKRVNQQRNKKKRTRKGDTIKIKSTKDNG